MLFSLVVSLLPAQQVRVIVDVSCAGKACGGLSGEGGTQASSDSEWCEVLLAQHIPEGAYVDVDEVKVRTRKERRVAARVDRSTLCTSDMHLHSIDDLEQLPRTMLIDRALVLC